MDVFKDYFFLGSVTRLHGYDGMLQLFLDVDDSEAYEDLQMVFININQGLVPHFIESSSLKNNKLIVRFQDVDSPEKAQRLVNKELYLPLSALPKLSGNKFYFHEVIGFHLVDKVFGELGEVSDILDYPCQALMQVFHEGKEVLIPLNDPVILKVDRTRRKLFIEAPEGLIDMYLNA
ncbi:MAG: 16S rRNA processing protein RimM [Bacteroidales bacterium]|nr:16S rRNA processing protein RimM [Bacteroidales bacterium]